MNEQDTVEWYLAQKAKVKAAKEYADMLIPPIFSCCGQLKTEGHHKVCVNFQPKGETKSNRIVQHLPGYIDFGIEIVAFDTLEELLAIEWVKWWSDHPGFYRFSLDNHLMAEFDNGYKWYALGRLRNPVNLPKWEAKYKNMSSEKLKQEG